MSREVERIKRELRARGIVNRPARNRTERLSRINLAGTGPSGKLTAADVARINRAIRKAKR